MQVMEARKVEVGPIHDMQCTGFRQEHVQDIDTVQFSVGNVDEGGDVSVQVEEGVELDSALCLAEPRPGKQRQAEVDG